MLVLLGELWCWGHLQSLTLPGTARVRSAPDVLNLALFRRVYKQQLYTKLSYKRPRVRVTSLGSKSGEALSCF